MKTSRFVATALVAIAVVFGATTALAGKGQVQPFSLSVQGMLDKQGVSDVYLTVGVEQDGFAAPTLAQHIQLKSFNLDGDLEWTRNVQGFPMVDNGDGSSVAALQYLDMMHHQPLKAQVQIHNDETGNTKVLRAKGDVLLRPDFTVTDVAPTGAGNINEPVNIVAHLKELNGDLGATATVLLKSGDTVLDQADNVYLDPRSAAEVVFTAVFAEAGDYALTVEIAGMEPADYDTTNNRLDFTLTIVEPLQTAQYNGYYQWQEGQYNTNYENDYYYNSYSFNGKYENLYYSMYLPQVLIAPVSRITIDLTVDGVPGPSYNVSDVPVSSSSYACDGAGHLYHYTSFSIGLGSGVSIYSYGYRNECTGYEYSYVTLNRTTADYVYTSIYHDKVYGYRYDYIDVPVVAGDTYLDATSTVNVRLVVTDSVGSYGGNGPLTIGSPVVRTDSYDYVSSGTHNWGSFNATFINGSGYGTTTP